MTVVAPLEVDYRRCPDHPDAELVPIPNCYAGGISCTGEVFSPEGMTFRCGARICGRCSGKGADWQSGLCSDCYRIVSRDRAEWQKKEHDHYVRSALMRDLIQQSNGRIEAWLMARDAEFDAAWNAVIEERYS